MYHFLSIFSVSKNATPFSASPPSQQLTNLIFLFSIHTREIYNSAVQYSITNHFNYENRVTAAHRHYIYKISNDTAKHDPK